MWCLGLGPNPRSPKAFATRTPMPSGPALSREIWGGVANTTPSPDIFLLAVDHLFRRWIVELEIPHRIFHGCDLFEQKRFEVERCIALNFAFRNELFDSGLLTAETLQLNELIPEGPATYLRRSS